MTPDADPGPVLRRRQVGARLRQLRESAGRTLDDVAAYLECSAAKISRIETGRLVARIPDVRSMLDLYGVTGQSRDELLEQVRQSRQRGWWQAYADVMPDGLDTLIGLEDAAQAIDWYEISLIPGLLQTRDYVQAMAGPRTDVPDHVLDRLVELRMATQAVLTRPNPPRLHVVLDESALRRGPDSPAVMRAQLEHLVEVAGQPHVIVQVIPFTAGFTASNVPFAIFGLPDPAQPRIVFTEQLYGGRYESRPELVNRFTTTFDNLRACAWSPADSARFIAARATEVS